MAVRMLPARDEHAHGQQRALLCTSRVLLLERGALGEETLPWGPCEPEAGGTMAKGRRGMESRGGGWRSAPRCCGHTEPHPHPGAELVEGREWDPPFGGVRAMGCGFSAATTQHNAMNSPCRSPGARGGARCRPGQPAPDTGSICLVTAVSGLFQNLIYKGKHQHRFLCGRLGSLWGLQSLGWMQHVAPVPLVP